MIPTQTESRNGILKRAMDKENAERYKEMLTLCPTNERKQLPYRSHFEKGRLIDIQLDKALLSYTVLNKYFKLLYGIL